jgi:hypothetical protein
MVAAEDRGLFVPFIVLFGGVLSCLTGFVFMFVVSIFPLY